MCSNRPSPSLPGSRSIRRGHQWSQLRPEHDCRLCPLQRNNWWGHGGCHEWGQEVWRWSYAFDSREHDIDIVSQASKLSTRLIEQLMKDWPEEIHLYSINIPLRKGVENSKIVYTEMLQNRWLSSSFPPKSPQMLVTKTQMRRKSSFVRAARPTEMLLNFPEGLTGSSSGHPTLQMCGSL